MVRGSEHALELCEKDKHRLDAKASAPSFLFSLCSLRALYHKLCLNVLIFKNYGDWFWSDYYWSGC